MFADNLSVVASGGLMIIDAVGNVNITADGVMHATGGSQGAGGGISLRSRGRVETHNEIDLTGGAGGGTLDITAGADVILDRVTANGTVDAASGGSVSVLAGTGAQIVGQFLARGCTSSDQTFGGDGGTLDVYAEFGDVLIAADIIAEGASPDGTGGSVTVSAIGSVTLQAGRMLSVRSNGTFSSGGDLSIDTNIDVTLTGDIDASGGSSGGSVDILAGRGVSITGAIDGTGRNDEGFGGAILVAGGFLGPGPLTMSNLIDVSGGGCSSFFCGEGGTIDVFGCDANVPTGGRLLNRGPHGGQTTITVREQLTINGGVIDSTGTGGGGVPGTNVFQYPTRKPPIVTGAIVDPPAGNQGFNTCTAIGQINCLDPCPTCGNGLVEYPEQCDTAGTPVSCDGCSAFCLLENCSDASPCTVDGCSPTLGCSHVVSPDGTSCSDGLVCNGNEHCTAGTCVGGTPLSCPDTNPCTLDLCQEPAGCVHPPAPSGTTCSDGNQCTINDACNGSSTCLGGGPRICDDTLECTTDSCVPATGCVFTNRTGACTDDGNVCTNDTCSGGACTHPNRADGTACTDDGNSCTNDTCSSGNCAHPPRLNGTLCDDGAFCTVSDGCVAGICVGGGPRSCADTNSCTTDACDEIGDVCSHAPVTPCCGNGVPEVGEPCDDGNASNTDACLVGCVAASCGDGFVRTGVETCDAGAANSNAPDASCRPDCTPARCGDGIVDPGRGEQCDDGGTAPGDGCSPGCFVEPPTTARLIGGKGNKTTDCAIEWAIDRPTLDGFGRPEIKQECRNGDSACDFGTGAMDCVFRLWVCSNNHDPSLSLCTPGSPVVGTPIAVDVTKPSISDSFRRPEDSQNRIELIRAANAADTTAFDACGPRIEVRVPLKAVGRAGSKSLKLKARTSRNAIDSDVLKLYCLP
jgi:cysteine-rich repeat protein